MRMFPRQEGERDHDADYARMNGFTIWLTGLPASGKSTLALLLKFRLETDFSRRVELLEGGQIRRDLSRRLGFSRKDREEHASRIAYLANLLSRNGVVCIVSSISPFRSSRETAREIIGRNRFVEVYVKAALTTCEGRDPKRLYAMAHTGEISDMTGVQQAYEEPRCPDITIDTESSKPGECVDSLIKFLERMKLVSREVKGEEDII